MWQAYQVCGGGVMIRKRNLEQLKNCPFCGNHELEFEDSTGDITCNACAYTYYDTSIDNGWWNSRPIEDTLTATIAQKDAEIARLRYALMDIDSYVDDESKIGRIIRKALEEVNDE